MKSFIFFLLLFLSMGMSFAKDVILIKVYEANKGSGCTGNESQIIISLPDGSAKTLPLNKLNVDTRESNASDINKILNQYVKEGYALKDASTSIWQCETITMFILER